MATVVVVTMSLSTAAAVGNGRTFHRHLPTSKRCKRCCGASASGPLPVIAGGPEEAMHKTIVRVIRHNEKVANIMMQEDGRRKTAFSVEDKQFGDDIHKAIEFAEALVEISYA